MPKGRTAMATAVGFTAFQISGLYAADTDKAQILQFLLELRVALLELLQRRWCGPEFSFFWRTGLAPDSDMLYTLTYIQCTVG